MELTQESIKWLAIIVCISQLLMAESVVNKCHVHVINGFSGNDTLEAHCKSKDDDLGLRNITVHNEFNWTFRTDFFSRTRFYCHMWWRVGQKTLDVFWMGDKFIEEDCGGNNCHWMAQNDGIYLYNTKHEEYRRKDNWDPWQSGNQKN